MIPIYRPTSDAVLRTLSIRSACDSAEPWEKLTRTTSTPASMRLTSVSTSSVAGPSVATILVRLRCEGACRAMAIVGSAELTGGIGSVENR